MIKRLLVRIILPSETLLEMEADMVNIPGADGVFGVLPEHAKLISTVKVGIISLFVRDIEKKYYVHGGIAQVTGDEVNIVTEYAADIQNTNKTDISNEIAALMEELPKEEEESIEADIILDKIEKHKSLIKFL